MVAFRVLVITVIAVVRHLGCGAGHVSPGPQTAEQLLGEPFSRGEIDDEEYRRRLDHLSCHADRAENAI